MFGFDELALYRRTLQEFCSYHTLSLSAFHSGCSFLLTPDERLSDNNLHHLTTTASCIESLLGCPKQFRSGSIDPTQLATDFARNAIDRPFDKWVSDGSAPI